MNSCTYCHKCRSTVQKHECERTRFDRFFWGVRSHVSRLLRSLAMKNFTLIVVMCCSCGHHVPGWLGALALFAIVVGE